MQKFRTAIKTMILMLLVASLVTGCGGKQKIATGPIFFPPEPDEPHIQYLTGVTSTEDFKSSKKSGISELVSGGVKTVTKIMKPFGVAVHNGKVYIADTGAAQLVEVDFINNTIRNLAEQKGPGQLKKPVGIAVAQDGLIYVADNGRKDIVVFSSKGYVKTLGKDLENKNMTGVAVFEHLLFALDNFSSKVFVMDRKTGDVLSAIGQNEDNTQNLSLPSGIAADKEGILHVVNMGNGTVKKYDRDGHMLTSFGRTGDRPGEFARPRSIAVDSEGQVYVVDGGHNVVQVFNKSNRILGFFGQPGLPAGSMNLPAGVAVSRDNLELFQKYAAPGFKLREIIFVTNQYQSPVNHVLEVYGLGTMDGWKDPEAAAPEVKGKKQPSNDKTAAGDPAKPAGEAVK